MIKAIKKLILLSSMAIAVSAHAASPGIYVGGQLGWGKIHFDDYESKHSTSFQDEGLAGRGFAGYQINPEFAVELGYTQLHNTTTTVDYTDGLGHAVHIKSDLKNSAVDLVGKATLPIQAKLNLFGTLGIAYLEGTAESEHTHLGATDNDSRAENHIYPTFGAGLSYELNKNLTSELAWSHIQRTDRSVILENTDFVGLGLTYHFN